MTSIECSAVEEMGEDDHVPIGINVNCHVRGTNISDQQLKRLKRAMERCPVKRIIAGGRNVAPDRDDYVRTSLQCETE